MTNISIEIVPHAADEIHHELDEILAAFPSIDTINIPDIVRLPTRSWQACDYSKEYIKTTIPHLRACDFDLDNTQVIDQILDTHQFPQILVVGGDFFEGREHYETSSIKLIQYIKQKYPKTKVYAAIDPYRSSFGEEVKYTKEKIKRGADGFFTQPFFDLQLLDLWMKTLDGATVYWGLSPVLSEKSQTYWEKRNLVNFPAGFQPTLEWNSQFAADAIELIKKNHTDLYFMPIRIPVVDYLNSILEKSPCLKDLLKL